MSATPPNSPYPTNSKRPRIFLSYASADKDRVTELYNRLQSVGTPWMDSIDVLAGDRLDLRIRDAIFSTDVMIVCLSHNSTSRTSFLEIEKSLFQRVQSENPAKSIITVRLDDSPVPKVLEQSLYINLFVPGGYDKLFAALESIRQEIEHDSNSAPDNSTVRPPKALDDTNVITVDEAQNWTGTLLKRGSSGTAVMAVQQRLKELGYEVTADGKYGSGTVKAVRTFQEQTNLRSNDGIVGPNTWAALFNQEPVEKKEDGASKAPPPQPTLKEGLDEEARERKALNDKPLDDVDKDALGFRDYVFALRDFIASQSTTTPLTISINGAWGSGKSSLMRMLQKQLEPAPLPRLQWLRDVLTRVFHKNVKQKVRPPLWWIKTKWLTGYVYGTGVWLIGWLLVSLRFRNATYIKLAFAFDPDEDVDKANFDSLFLKCVDFSIRKDLGAANGDPGAQTRIDKERERRAQKTRFWARQVVRRRKMTPPDHPTIWFNAWKFNQQEQLWAALASAVIEQLKKKYGFFARLYLLLALTWKRSNKLRAVNEISKKLILPILIAGVIALYNLYFAKQHKEWLSKDGWWLWVAPVLAAMWQAFRAIEDPFKLPINELVTSPDYKGKVGFIGTFEEDFGRIVDVAIRRSIFWQPRKLVIFIDDLDRCGPTQAAGIVEAINLFLDSVGCVFVLGMDMNAVALSMEVKYKELTERMRKDAPDDVSPGVLFLDKIVQIPFNVPRPNKAYMEALVLKITEPASRDLPAIVPSQVELPVSQTEPLRLEPAEIRTAETTVKTPPPSIEPKVDRASFAKEDIRQAITFATGLLKENPRQVKRFINLFRLQVYIANERGLLSEDADRLNPRILAVWVAWFMQWPEILRLLSNTGQTAELRQHLAMIASELHSPSTPQGVWRVESNSKFFAELTKLRESSSMSHWSHLPWHPWTQNTDFLYCLKALELYWQRPDLLDSMLDMSKVSVGENKAAATSSPVVGV